MPGVLAQADATVFVLSASPEFTPPRHQGIREVALMARQAGLMRLIVVLDTTNAGAAQADDLELAVRRLLHDLGHAGDELPVFRTDIGQPEDGLLDELLSLLEHGLPTRAGEATDPLRLPLLQADLFTHGELLAPGESWSFRAGGRVMAGELRVGEQVEAVGLTNRKISLIVRSFPYPDGAPETVRAGELVRVILGGPAQVPLPGPGSGVVLAAPGTLTAVRHFSARLTFLPTSEGGRTHRVQTGYRPRFLLGAAVFRGTVRPPPGVHDMYPGETYSVEVELPAEAPRVMDIGQTFTLREPGKIVGFGEVQAVLG